MHNRTSIARTSYQRILKVMEEKVGFEPTDDLFKAIFAFQVQRHKPLDHFSMRNQWNSNPRRTRDRGAS